MIHVDCPHLTGEARCTRCVDLETALTCLAGAMVMMDHLGRLVDRLLGAYMVDDDQP